MILRRESAEDAEKLDTRRYVQRRISFCSFEKPDPKLWDALHWPLVE